MPYEALHIPASCMINTTIFKKHFYENADLTSADKKLFTESVSKIIWRYCLKPATINIPKFKDDERDYPEIELVEVQLESDTKIKRIAEIIMRAIPYPMLLFFRTQNNMVRVGAAHQRISLNDKNKNTLEEFIFTDWLVVDDPLFAKLDIKKMRSTNYWTLYSDFVDAISIYNVASIIPIEAGMTGERARIIASEVYALEQQIASLRMKIKNEIQFNRRVELNVTIKKLEQQKNKLLGGNIGD